MKNVALKSEPLEQRCSDSQLGTHRVVERKDDRLAGNAGCAECIRGKEDEEKSEGAKASQTKALSCEFKVHSFDRWYTDGRAAGIGQEKERRRRSIFRSRSKDRKAKGPLLLRQEGFFAQGHSLLVDEVRGEPFSGARLPGRFPSPARSRLGYRAYAAAFDETIDATLGIFSACGDLRSQPARSHDSGTENSE